MKTKIANPFPSRLLLFACMIGLLFCSCGTGKSGITNRKEMKNAGRSDSRDDQGTIFYRHNVNFSSPYLDTTHFSKNYKAELEISFSTNREFTPSGMPISRVTDSLSFVLSIASENHIIRKIDSTSLRQESHCDKGGPNRFNRKDWNYPDSLLATSECTISLAQSGCKSDKYDIDGHLVVVLDEIIGDSVSLRVSIASLKAYKNGKPVPTQQVGN